jgi:hypothetical protein
MFISATTSSQTNTAAPSAAQEAQETSKEAADWFLSFMRESPAQQLEDEWLQAHHLTEADLANMPPAQREKIIKEMEQDIKTKTQQELENKMKSAAPISF